MLQSSSSSSISRHKYDVFLSFRGEDTRRNFTDHLYTALRGSGIITFRDDERLEAGEAIAPELFKAIKESWCSVIVFSETYAFSGWCLDELAEIVKQRKERGHKVFPIFYDVDPSHLRKQNGKVGEAFAKHEETFKDNKDKIERWRCALTHVANLKGWHLNDRHESEFIGDIVRKISAKLCQTYSVVRDDLIGIDKRLEELHAKIDIEEDDVRIIGICGMGGMGKTTLARAVYTQMSPHFEGKCFLADVREVSEKYGLVSLQKQLLSQILSEEGFHLFNVYDGNDMISRRLSLMKVLIVVDDVDNLQHLKCLVGRHDWFGSGSRIIITTRDEHLLRSYRVDDVYKPTTLNANEALRLFSLKAFNSDTVPRNDDFLELSERVVGYADGLPLALEVYGSFLCGRDVAQWRSAIERLKRDSNEEILDRLRISFDGLEETEKNIFLDIACFFKGEDKNFVTKILDGCEFFPDIGIDMLIKKSLITVDVHDKLRMHDLLQEMGRKIVRQKSIDEPGKRCRLWDEKDVNHVLTENTVTEAVEGMIIDINNYQVTTPQNFNSWYQVTQIFNIWEQEKKFTLSGDAFAKMKKLRLLRVFNPSNFGEINYLSKELRLLEWPRYPFKSLPSSFQPDNLVALLLPYSRIEQLWTGNRQLEKLKLINLEGCKNLVSTPNFTRMPNLESLILEGCTRLVDVHPSVGVLRRLKLLDLKDCNSLVSLPTKIKMESLETFILSGCSNLRRFPEIDEKAELLEELCLDGTGIRELPASIGHLSGLKLLNLRNCKSLRRIPTKIGMKCLEKLILSSCSSLEKFPDIDEEMDCLVELYLDGTGIKELPSSIEHLSSLALLTLKDCRNLESLPSSMGGLKCLKTLILCGCTKVESLPEELQQLESLEELDLSETAIRKPQSFIFQYKNLKVLSFSGCKGPPFKSKQNLPSLFNVMQRGSTNSMGLVLPPNLSGLTSLRKLNLSDCNLGEGIISSNIGCLSSLEWLDLSGNNFISLPATLTQLSKLDFLKLSDCKRLKSLPELLTSIRGVVIEGCDSLEVFAIPTTLTGACPSYIYGVNCYKWVEKNNVLTMLKKYIKVFANANKGVHIIMPGSEIPDWFIHQNEGSSIKIQLPPHSKKDSKWMGIALCGIFVSPFNDAQGDDKLDCVARVSGHGENGVVGFRFEGKFRRQRVTKEHLWLRYWSTKILGRIDLTGEIELLFEPSSIDEVCPKIKKVGARLVFEKDLQDDEIIECIQGQTTNIRGGLLKRKLNIYEQDEAAGLSDESETPPPPK